MSYLGTLRARTGVLIVPSFLLYATGGLAYGGARSDTTIVQFIDDPPLSTLMTSGSFSKTRVDMPWVPGGKWMLSSNWSAKLEYLCHDLGSVTCATGGLASDIGAALNPATGTGVAAVAASSQVRFKDSIVRVGVNHHFGSPAVSARPSCEASVSRAPHSSFKCDPNRENRLTSADRPMPRRAGVVHVCIQIKINCLVD